MINPVFNLFDHRILSTIKAIQFSALYLHIKSQVDEKYDTDISLGSVKTHLRCGGIFIDNANTHFLLISTVKKLKPANI